MAKKPRSLENEEDTTVMNGEYFVLVDTLLGLYTNAKHFKWSYGIDPPPADRQAFDNCLIRLILEVGPTEQQISENRLSKYHYFHGVPQRDQLFYERPFICSSQLQLRAKGLLTDTPCFQVNRPYYRFVTHRFMNLHSVGYILTDVSSLLLLRQGYAPLHCSAFRHRDSTVLVFAPPNTGKTLTTMAACMDYGAQFLAEDLAVTDGKEAFSVPWTSTFRYYSQVDRRPWARMIDNLTRKIPILELLPIVKSRPINTYLDESQMLSRAVVTHVAILERGQSASVTDLDHEEAQRRIQNLNRYEFNYQKAPFNVAYEYFNPGVNIEHAYQTEKRISQVLITNAKKLLLVRADDPLQYAPLLLNSLT